MRRQVTLYHKAWRSSWYSADRPQKDERLSRPLNYPAILKFDPWIGNTAH